MREGMAANAVLQLGEVKYIFSLETFSLFERVPVFVFVNLNKLETKSFSTSHKFNYCDLKLSALITVLCSLFIYLRLKVKISQTCCT